jgi:hypothetical protein
MKGGWEGGGRRRRKWSWGGVQDFRRRIMNAEPIFYKNFAGYKCHSRLCDLSGS